MNHSGYSVQDPFAIQSIGITNSRQTMLLRHIRYFLAVAEHRNFTRAAEALHVCYLPRSREQIGLFPVPLEFAAPERTAVLLQRAGAYRTAAARAFVELALAMNWNA